MRFPENLKTLNFFEFFIFYGFIGNYFIRYADHGTPFDTGLDETIIEEDILAMHNEGSGYFSEDSDEESEELRKEFVDEDNIK